MPAINFKKQFVTPIVIGEKPGTVRQRRKNPIKDGDVLYLYTGMRTKKCRKFMTCKAVRVYRISIHPTFITINGLQVIPIVRYLFASLDGFTSIESFTQFFKDQYGLPFKGDWIVWSSATVKMVDEYINAVPFTKPFAP